jgi:meso-butanediol dehydrogenase / (S,S)-butanediol dehydrogenase / diacetyl reductase
MRLRGKVALVTGAASGIGHAVAMLFSQEGARVAIADINDEAGRQTAIDLGGKEVAAIDILVNNAAIVLFKRLVDTEPAEWDKVIATNLRSVYLCSRYTIPHMIRSGRGAIVNISSARAFATTPLVSSYDASKGAIVALTRSMALEYASNGIRVNCVLPGAVDTPVFRANLRADGREEDQYRATVNHIPLGRIGQPLDIAKAVLFLASDESSYVTGAPFLVDGGLLAQA